MKFNFLERTSPTAKLFFSLGIILISAIFFSLIGFLLALPLFDTTFTALITGIESYQPENIALLKYLQVVQSIGLFIVPPLVLAAFFSGKPLTFLGLKSKTNNYGIMLVILIMVSAIPAINLIAELNSKLDLPGFMKGIEEWMTSKENMAERITKMFLKADTTWGLIINLMVIAVIPAIGEELFFRGLLQRLFIDLARNKHLGIILAALVFSAFHMQFYGFVPRFLLGAMFGYLFLWSGSLWVTIIAHFINNGIAVLFFYFAGKHNLDTELENIGAQEGTTIMAFFSLFTVIVLLWVYKNYTRRSFKEI